MLTYVHERRLENGHSMVIHGLKPQRICLNVRFIRGPKHLFLTGSE